MKKETVDFTNGLGKELNKYFGKITDRTFLKTVMKISFYTVLVVSLIDILFFDFLFTISDAKNNHTALLIYLAVFSLIVLYYSDKYQNVKKLLRFVLYIIFIFLVIWAIFFESIGFAGSGILILIVLAIVRNTNARM